MSKARTLRQVSTRYLSFRAVAIDLTQTRKRPRAVCGKFRVCSWKGNIIHWSQIIGRWDHMVAQGCNILQERSHDDILDPGSWESV